MANILSISTPTSFSVPSLDAASASAEELDPRFVEELQGAMGQLESEPAVQSEVRETSLQETESSDSDASTSLQNLPLMPWAMIAAPANFAPQDAVNTSTVGDGQALDALASVGAGQAIAFNTTPLSAVSEASAMVSAAGAVAVTSTQAAPSGSDGQIAASAATVASDQLQSSTVSPALEDASAVGSMPQASLATATPDLNPQDEIRSSDAGLASANASTSGLTPLVAAVASDGAIATAVPATHQDRMSATAELQLTMDGAAMRPAVSTSMPVAAEPAPATQGQPAGQATAALETDPALQPPATMPDTQDAKSSGSAQAQAASAAASVITATSVRTESEATTVSDAIAPLPASPTTQTLFAQTQIDDPAVASVATASGSGDVAIADPVTEAASPSPVANGGLDVTPPVQAAALSTTEVSAQATAVVTSVPAGQVDAASQVAQRRAEHEDGLERTSTVRASTQASAEPSVAANADVVTTASVPNSTSTSATKDDEQPAGSFTQATVAAAGMSAHKGQNDLVRGSDNPMAAKAVFSDASTTAPLSLNAQASGAMESGSPARTGGAAESTFASSFVQALMGHVHQPVAHHAQALEVVPSPSPIAPHQVRFDAGQVQVEVVRLVKQGGGQVVMELTPPDESKFKIDLSISQQGVARLVVDGASESTRLRLEQTVSGLQDQFQQMGLQLQLDMRQSQQHEAQARPDSAPTLDLSGPVRTSRQEAVVVQPVTGRPAWEQGQVYLVA